MKKFTLLLALALSTLSFAEPPMPSDELQTLVINNRILATVNDRSISVIDVMKKMDVYLVRHYPHLANSKTARYQFYSAHWRETLDQIVNTELMLLDAEQKEITVTDAEVRESIQERFGPNVMGNLEKIGITYEEAKELVHSDMIVQRMTWFRVNSKALHTVNPQDIKAAYQEHCVKNPPVEQWKYQVVSIRGKNGQEGAKIAEKAHQLLKHARVGLAELAKTLGKEQTDSNAVTITVSDTLDVEDKNLSQSHKEVLSKLTLGTYSEPIAQVSRVDKTTVHRIFHLLDHTKQKLPSFGNLSSKLTDDLLDQAVAKESTAYIAKLREHFGFQASSVQNLIPADFQPFNLK